MATKYMFLAKSYTPQYEQSGHTEIINTDCTALISYDCYPEHLIAFRLGQSLSFGFIYFF